MLLSGRARYRQARRRVPDQQLGPVETHLPDGFIMVFSPVKMNIEDISGQNEQGHAARDQ